MLIGHLKFLFYDVLIQIFSPFSPVGLYVFFYCLVTDSLYILDKHLCFIYLYLCLYPCIYIYILLRFENTTRL